MHVVIITPAFNVAPYISDTIRSVLTQSHDDWSMVVIDDGSSDGTGDIAAAYRDSRIHLIRQPNAGVSGARNRGIASLQDPRTDHPWATKHNQKPRPAADAILFLDGDDWLAPTALFDLVSALHRYPSAIAAVARYVRVRWDGTYAHSGAPPRGHLLPSLLTRNLFANGGHVLVRATAIDQTGSFRSDLDYGEDWEYWTRLALLGPFAAVRTRRPALFVRERRGSAYNIATCDPARHIAVHHAIYSNPTIIGALEARRLQASRRSAEAETAWTIGREFIRHGDTISGSRWLRTSLASRPSVKRLCMIPLAWLGSGPFRAYGSQLDNV